MSQVDFGYSEFGKFALKTVDEWTSVLRLSSMWGFQSIRTLAIEHLSMIAGPVDKIVLGHAFDVSRWLPEAYLAICDRTEPLTIDEGERLGVKDVVRINAAREAMRTRAIMSANRVREIVGSRLSVDLPPSLTALAPAPVSHCSVCRSLHAHKNDTQTPKPHEDLSEKPSSKERAPAAVKQPLDPNAMRSVTPTPANPDDYYVSYLTACWSHHCDMVNS